jgi:hypothetical protein
MHYEVAIPEKWLAIGALDPRRKSLLRVLRYTPGGDQISSNVIGSVIMGTSETTKRIIVVKGAEYILGHRRGKMTCFVMPWSQRGLRQEIGPVILAGSWFQIPNF